MPSYLVTFRCQVKYSIYVDADSPEEAKDEGQVNLDFELSGVDIEAINSVHVHGRAKPQQPAAIEGEK